MAKKEPTESPALHLVRHVARHEGHKRGRSRQQSAEAVQAAVRLAIRYGLRFDLGDFRELATPRTQSYHPTYTYYAGEYEYSLACGSERASENRSAALSYEQWRGRRPYMIEEEGCTTPTRIYVGRQFWWRGKLVTCTSFDDVENPLLVACSYQKRSPDDPYSRQKVERRFTITHVAISDERRRLDLFVALKQYVDAQPPARVQELRDLYLSRFGSEGAGTLKELRAFAAEIGFEPPQPADKRPETAPARA